MIDSKIYKPILVFYIGLYNRTSEEVKNIKEQLNEHFISNGSFIGIILAKEDSSQIDVKCINPILLTRDQYDEVYNLIEEVKEEISNIKIKDGRE